MEVDVDGKHLFFVPKVTHKKLFFQVEYAINI